MRVVTEEGPMAPKSVYDVAVVEPVSSRAPVSAGGVVSVLPEPVEVVPEPVGSDDPPGLDESLELDGLLELDGSPDTVEAGAPESMLATPQPASINVIAEKMRVEV